VSGDPRILVLPETRVFSKDKGEEIMRKLVERVKNFLAREDGPTAVEYAVMLALIIVVCITAITALGSNANKTFTSVGNSIGATSS
jgi:pilus assembly protein Flp/PilA